MQFQVTIPTAKGDDYSLGVIAETEEEAKRIAYDSFKNVGAVKKGNIIVKLVEEQQKQLVVIDDIFPDSLPNDFRTNPDYLNKIDKFVAQVSGLVPEDTEEGEKQVKELATKIRKVEKNLLSFVKQVFDAETAEVTEWKDSATATIKQLGPVSKSIVEIFEARKKERLATVRTLLIEELTKLYDESKIPQELRKMDISALVLQGSLTAGGKLTKKAQEALNTKLYDAIRAQTLINQRVLVIDNECLKAGINPPITKEYLGAAFMADESVFMDKLAELVQTEVKRREQAEEIAAKKLAAQQAKAAQQPSYSPATSTEPAVKTQPIAPQQPKLQIGEVALTATFKANMPNHFTDEQLLSFFTTRLNSIFLKAKQSGLLDEKEERFLSTLDKLEVFRA